MTSPDDRDLLLLRRLLGARGPEIGCEECFSRIDEYVELELGGAQPDAAIPGMRAHLLGCPACAEEHESLRALAGGPPGQDPEAASPPTIAP